MEQPDVGALADAVRESGIALKPGDVLAVRLPSGFNAHELGAAREYANRVEADTGIKVAFIPGEEFAHTTVNVTVNGFAGDSHALGREIYERFKNEIYEHIRTEERRYRLMNGPRPIGA